MWKKTSVKEGRRRTTGVSHTCHPRRLDWHPPAAQDLIAGIHAAAGRHDDAVDAARRAPLPPPRISRRAARARACMCSGLQVASRCRPEFGRSRPLPPRVWSERRSEIRSATGLTSTKAIDVFSDSAEVGGDVDRFRSISAEVSAISAVCPNLMDRRGKGRVASTPHAFRPPHRVALRWPRPPAQSSDRIGCAKVSVVGGEIAGMIAGHLAHWMAFIRRGAWKRAVGRAPGRSSGRLVYRSVARSGERFLVHLVSSCRSWPRTAERFTRCV